MHTCSPDLLWVTQLYKSEMHSVQIPIQHGIRFLLLHKKIASNLVAYNNFLISGSWRVWAWLNWVFCWASHEVAVMELTGVCSSLELVRGLPNIPWLLILAVPEQVPLSCSSSARGCSQVQEPHSSLPYSSHWPFKTAAHIKSSRRISSPRVSYNVT